MSGNSYRLRVGSTLYVISDAAARGAQRYRHERVMQLGRRGVVQFFRLGDFGKNLRNEY